eukprot:g4379.t1
MSVMVLGCDSESLEGFMKMFPETTKRTRSMSCVLQNTDGISFKLVTMKNTSRNIQATTTLPPQMFKNARNRDTIAVCVCDFDSKMSSSKAYELIPKSLEQACYIFQEKYKKKFRVEAMMEGKATEVRPPLQTLVVGFSSKGNKVYSEDEFRDKLADECAEPSFIAESKLEKSTKAANEWLKQIDCIVIDDAASAKEMLLLKLKEKYDFRFRMNNDGTVKTKTKRRKSSRRSGKKNSSSDPSTSSDSSGSCCLVQ